jgi:hypothetical protein
MSHDNLDSVQKRLDRLERENRWWKVIGCIGSGVLVILGVIVLRASADLTVQDEIRARQIVLVDRKQWRDRIVMTTDVDASPVMRFVGSDGRIRASLGLDADSSPRLTLADDAASVRLAPGGIELVTGGKRTTLGAGALGFGTEGTSSPATEYAASGLRIGGPDGAVALGVGAAGPVLDVKDAQGGTKVILAVSPGGDISLSFFEKDGKLRAMLGHVDPAAARRGASPGLSLVWLDPSGKVVWRAPQTR